MSNLDLPLIIEPETLAPLLGQERLLVVDLTKPSTYAQLHVPGAVFLDYRHIVANRKPIMGLLPSAEELEQIFSATGIGDSVHVIAYDDEGGGKASRLLWTLETMGHHHFSLLNGGLHAWANEGHPVEQTPNEPVPRQFRATPNSTPIADAKYILQHLESDDVALLDARTADEFTGAKHYAERGGHIPGAVNMDWMLALDQSRNLRLKDPQTLQAMLTELGITPDRQVVTYCHTHHRSSLSYIMLKALGYERIKGYPGSWSDWGNRQDTPVA